MSSEYKTLFERAFEWTERLLAGHPWIRWIVFILGWAYLIVAFIFIGTTSEDIGDSLMSPGSLIIYFPGVILVLLGRPRP